MRSALQETYTENGYLLHTKANEEETVEGQIIADNAWLKLQQNLHLYAQPSKTQKSDLLPQLTSSLNELFKLLYQLVEFNALVEAVTSKNFSGNSIERAELVSDGVMVLEALTVFGRYPSELLDLPGQSGLYISLDQPVVINQYTKSNSEISEQCAISKLNRVLCTHVDTRQALAFEPNWGNIVEMQSLVNKSVILCVRYQYSMPHSLPRKGHIYYPITANRSEQSSFFARQVQRYS